MGPRNRRVVLGADAEGAVSVWSDGASPHVHTLPGYPDDLALVDLWYTGAQPAAPGSDAAEKGIRRGDVILSVNRQGVTAPAQVLAAVDEARRAGRNSVLLLVTRGQQPEAFFGVDISAR